MARLVQLKDIATIMTGNTPKTAEADFYNSDDIPFIKPSDIIDSEVTRLKESEFYLSEKARSVARIAPKGSILVTCIGIVGKISVLERESAFNQQINAVIPKENIVDSIFLAYALESKKRFMQEKANSAVVPIINKTSFSEIEIPLPPLDEQRHIAAILDKITSLIALRKQQLAKLDELVRARFVEMFGDLGKNIYQWGMVPLRSICTVNPKKSCYNWIYNDTKISFVPMTSVTETGEIDVSIVKEYDEVKTGFTYFEENDVLFAKITPCMENGKGAIAKGLCNGIGFGSTEFHVLRPIESKSNPYWLYVLTTFPKFRTDAANHMTGSAGQRRVPSSFLANYLVSAPPIALQEKFATFVEEVNKFKLTVRQSLDILEVLKRSLMQEIFNEV